MTPRIHLVRHAQGLHNVSAANHTIVDPALTAYGRRQCSKLASTQPAGDRIALLAASPLQRTLDTARLSFPKFQGLIIAIPDAQEVGDLPCDHGKPLVILKENFESLGVDLSLVPHGWELKKGRYAKNVEALQNRARDLRLWLRQKSQELKDDGDVVLVSHGGFLHFLTEDWSDYDRFSGTGWKNTECRTYHFHNGSDGEARMVETAESKARRGSLPKPDRSKYMSLQKVKAAEKQPNIKQHTRTKTLDNEEVQKPLSETNCSKI